MDRPAKYHGMLIESVSAVFHRAGLADLRGVEDPRQLRNSEWEQYTLESKTPLCGEDDFPPSESYRYPVLYRASHRRAVIATASEKAVDAILAALREAERRVESVSIMLDPFVRSIVAGEHVTPKDAYSLSFVHARVPAFGTALRAISFYGDDLGEARLFRDHIPSLNCYTCGIRPTVGSAEIVRLRSDGRFSFYFASTERLKQIERLFTLLRANGWLVPPVTGKADTTADYDDEQEDGS